MIAMQIGRVVCGACETCLFMRNQDNRNNIMRMEYFNILIECLLNLLILYFFVSVAKSPPQQARSESKSDAVNLSTNVDTDQST